MEVNAVHFTQKGLSRPQGEGVYAADETNVPQRERAAGQGVEATRAGVFFGVQACLTSNAR